jgi:hypothetical protein
LNFDHVNDYAIQEGLTSVNTFGFYNTYKKTNWLSVKGNPINWCERLREWDIDDSNHFCIGIYNNICTCRGKINTARSKSCYFRRHPRLFFDQPQSLCEKNRFCAS